MKAKSLPLLPPGEMLPEGVYCAMELSAYRLAPHGCFGSCGPQKTTAWFTRWFPVVNETPARCRRERRGMG